MRTAIIGKSIMLKTLIVEDNVPFRQSLKEILCERFPAMVAEEAGDGKEALQKVDAFLPHLVFMDIKLPDENGLEVTKKIKDRHSEIIVIILTSYDLPEYRQAADEYGADHFLAKGSSSREEIVVLVESISSKLNLGLGGPDKGKQS
jgi:DNA-binding NarL/FixJ family response regulator